MVDGMNAAAASESFRAPILRGLAWKTATRVLFEVSKLAVGIALARLLTPVEYGLAGMVLVLVVFEPVLAGVAVASVLVQRKEIDEDDRSTVFWTCVAVGFTASAIGVAASWPVARFYGEPRVQPLFAALSLCFAISSLGSTHAHLLVREMNFRALELRAMAGALVGSGLAVGFAAAGFGPWALVVQPLAAITYFLPVYRPTYTHDALPVVVGVDRPWWLALGVAVAIVVRFAPAPPLGAAGVVAVVLAAAVLGIGDLGVLKPQLHATALSIALLE
jgi:O-antigen/teichoic acid export membrane protein